MQLTKESVELLAPAGTWEVLVAAIEAGADAVYLGGKHFNMRMHRTDTNFDDAKLKEAIDYAHAHNVKLYITINNLISEKEIEPLKEYLKYLQTIRPDAILVQDFAVLEIARELKLDIPLHTSVMMNTHNVHAINKLKEYGITRIVVGREMTLSQLRLFRKLTGLEVEYFMHGDMCISHSGQCYHSGVVFGQSGNRGRCLKPCRWAYKLIDEETGEIQPCNTDGDYKLALKDMCMYRNIPELIQAGVYSFKIEGRMRTADFVKRIVATYRKAIDAYIADPFGYATDEDAWQELYDNRSRDFSTCFALGKPDKSDIGFDGTREPRFFSQAVQEAGMNTIVTLRDEKSAKPAKPKLSVEASDLDSLTAAAKAGADIVYIGGEAFRPNKPWQLSATEKAIEIAHSFGSELIISTPRATMERECGELEQFLTAMEKIRPDGIMTSNLGSFSMAKNLTTLPVHTDFSFNLFNHLAAKFIKTNGSVKASYSQLKELTEKSELPIEIIVQGAVESMLLDHNIVGMNLDFKELINPSLLDRHFALLDNAREIHSIRIDQFGRNHLFFGKDLCLLPYLAYLAAAAAFRINGKLYSADELSKITAIYRTEIDKLAPNPSEYEYDTALTEKIAAISSRPLGVGAFRYRVSR
jgi:putative protease